MEEVVFALSGAGYPACEGCDERDEVGSDELEGGVCFHGVGVCYLVGGLGLCCEVEFCFGHSAALESGEGFSFGVDPFVEFAGDGAVVWVGFYLGE